MKTLTFNVSESFIYELYKTKKKMKRNKEAEFNPPIILRFYDFLRTKQEEIFSKKKYNHINFNELKCEFNKMNKKKVQC